MIAACLALASGCGGTRAAAPAPTGDRVVDLRVRVAAEPEDLDARRELARLELDGGRPGAALRQLVVLDRNGALDRQARTDLARLLVERARARLALGDGGALEDLDRARRVDRTAAARQEATARFEVEAVFAAILAALRAGERDAAQALARRARALAPEDERLRFATPDAGPIAGLGAAGLWLWRGDARRAALDLLDRYGDRGGSDPEVLAAWVAARGWWRGTGGGFDLLTRRRLNGLGVSLCPVAADPDDHGCAGTLGLVANRPAEAVAVFERARARRWRTADPDDAAAWSIIAGHAWRAGQVGSWTEAIAERVDGFEGMPGVQRPAKRAPARPPALLRRWRAVLVADARLQAAAGRLLARWGLSVDDGVRTAARLPLALGAPPAGPAAPLGLAIRPAPPALADIARAFARDAALADRLAADWVDGAAAVGERAPLVAEQFLRLGDPARALDWMEKAVAESPRHPPYLHQLAHMAAAAGDPVRAQVHFIEAAARSGDAGRHDLAAAALLLRAGHPIEALTAARRALGESAPGEEGPALDAVAAAAADAGRSADAERACADQLARIPERFRASWPSRRDQALAGSTGLDAPDDAELAAARAPRLVAAGKRDQALAALETAAEWQPDDPVVRAALLELLPVDEPRWAEVAAELLLVGLAARPPQAVPALEAFAAAAERLGRDRLARAARAEARGLAAVMPARARGCARRTPGR